jgi:serine/threonine-protein kinase
VLIGVDGVARVLDFGIAKAGGRSQITRDGQLKGKLSYFPPEQLTQEHAIDRRADVYAAAATLWEALAGRKMIVGENEFQRMQRICSGEQPPPSQFADVPEALDAIVMKGLARDPAQRFATAKAMALALEGVFAVASPRAIGEWVEAVGGDALAKRAERVGAIERHSAEMASSNDSIDGPVSMTLGSAGRSSVPPSSPSMRSTRTSVPPGRSLAPPAMDLDEEPAPRRRRGGWLFLLLLLLLVGGGAAAYGMGLEGRVREALTGERGPASSTPTAPTARSAAVSGASSPAPPATGAMPVADIATTATSIPTTTAPTTPVLDAPPADPTTRAHRPSRPQAAPIAPHDSAPSAPAAPPAATPKGDCDVPFMIDAQGIRHPKLECL